MTSFSDVALELPSDAHTLHDTFQAKYVTQYLEDYVDSHMYNGTSLRSRIRLNAKVQLVERTASGWTLYLGKDKTRAMKCRKLAVASGLTSEPNMPTIPGDHKLRAPVLHHCDFGRHLQEYLTPSVSHLNVTVLGGGKSAADMVYASLKAGKNVSWIIRRNGEGPGIFMNPAASGRYRHNAEKGATQNGTALNPSGFRPMADWAKRLHQSESERGNLESKLFASDRRYKAWADYNGRKGALPCFRELEPMAS